MAVDPEQPFNREEMYLADAAGEDVEVPPCPWSRKEAYLAAISGRLDGIDERIAALSTDISLKGGVATETDLPSGAAVGDAYITEDTGVMYVWVGDDWVALGGTGINVVQTTGTSQTDVMSQNATTGMVYQNTTSKNGIWISPNTYGKTSDLADGCVSIGKFSGSGNNQKGGNFNARNCVVIGTDAHASTDDVIAIGQGANATSAGSNSVNIGINAQSSASSAVSVGESAKGTGTYAVSVGKSAYSKGYSVAIGVNAATQNPGSIALGAFSSASATGEMNIGTSDASSGYNYTNYRLLSGVHDPVNDHDAATKGYVDAHAGGGGGATPLTAADYNYHVSGTEDDTVALWKMPAGIYESYSTGVKTGMYNPQSYSANAIFVVRHPNSDLSCITAFVGSAIYPDIPSLTSYGGGVIDVLVKTTTGERITNLSTYGNSYRLLNTIEVQDNLTSTRTDIPLSANQGKVLKGLIDNLTARVAALEGQ